MRQDAPLHCNTPSNRWGLKHHPQGARSLQHSLPTRVGRCDLHLYHGQNLPRNQSFERTPDADANARLWNDISFRFGGFVGAPVFQMLLDGLDSKFSTDSRPGLRTLWCRWASSRSSRQYAHFFIHPSAGHSAKSKRATVLGGQPLEDNLLGQKA